MKYSGHRKLMCIIKNNQNLMLLTSSDTKRTLMHLFLFTNSVQRELVSICTQSIRNCNYLSLHHNLEREHFSSELAQFLNNFYVWRYIYNRKTNILRQSFCIPWDTYKKKPYYFFWVSKTQNSSLNTFYKTMKI